MSFKKSNESSRTYRIGILGKNWRPDQMRRTISTTGYWFSKDRVLKLQEAAEKFADKGLVIEILGDELADGSRDIGKSDDLIAVRITLGLNKMSSLSEFWKEVGII